MATHYINRSNDEEIIDILRTVLDNGTGKAETPHEHILIKLMQIRGTPITSFEFDQDRVDFHYKTWKEDSSKDMLDSDLLKYLIDRNGVSGAPITTRRHGKWYEAVIGIDDNNSAFITLTDDSLDALKTKDNPTP